MTDLPYVFKLMVDKSILSRAAPPKRKISVPTATTEKRQPFLTCLQRH